MPYFPVNLRLTAHLQKKKPTDIGWLFCCLVGIWSELGKTQSSGFQR
jgi:hypothetical protein